MGAGNDENYHNKIDDEDHLDDKEDGMGDNIRMPNDYFIRRGWHSKDNTNIRY